MRNSEYSLPHQNLFFNKATKQQLKMVLTGIRQLNFEILKHLPDDDLFSFCHNNKYLMSLYVNPELWRRKLELFNIKDLMALKPNEMLYSEFYIFVTGSSRLFHILSLSLSEKAEKISIQLLNRLNSIRPRFLSRIKLK